MNVLEIVRLLVRFFYLIAFTAVGLAALVFLSTKDGKKEYATHTLLNTGLISGYSIESSSSARVDYAKTNNELENLINLATAYETNKELSARLMAHFLLLHKEGQLGILPENYPDFEETLADIPIDYEKEIDEEGIFYKIIQARDENKHNSLYKLTNSPNPFFGIEQLESILVLREGNSDMIRMEYTSFDPYLSQVTLEFLTEIFMAKQKLIKEGQSDSVIEFFKTQMDESSYKLKAQEDELLRFRVNNKIINYYEQTRFISGNKEELDKQYQNELKTLAGAKSAIARIEMEISDKQLLPQIHAELAAKRSDIAHYQKQLTALELIQDSVETQAQIIKKSELQYQINQLETEMSNDANKLLLVNQTPEGIETKDILTQWLNNIIIKEESTAKLEVMEVRKKEYENIYSQFAPLGSTLKRLEREIDVAERAYLENLHSYNQARLHKYSMMMSSDLKVIDAPYYPIKPMKSKRMMMVILAFLVGAILPTAVVITLELLDSNLKNPENAKEQTGLSIGGIMPKVPMKKTNIDFKALNRQAMNLFIQQLRSETAGLSTPKNVVIFSMNNSEGKSYLINQINDFYGNDDNTDDQEFSISELPAILHNTYKEQEVADADIIVLIARANRKWTESDKHALEVFEKTANKKPILFLNGVTTDVMEDVIGEVPKRRSWLRRKIKQMVAGGINAKATI